jgi:hypothetical protein
MRQERKNHCPQGGPTELDARFPWTLQRTPTDCQ